MLSRFVEIKGLTNLLGSNGEVLINTNGLILDSEGNRIPTSIDEDGHVTVNVRGWDGLRTYRVIDLVAIQYKSLQIPVSKYSSVIAFVIDGDKSNLHAGNVGYRFKDGKLESKDFPGHYYIPGFTRYVINEKGDMINSHTGRKMRWLTSRSQKKKNITGGYHITSVWFSARVFTSIGRHRALCLVFKDYPDNVDNLVTNHLDGVPGNDALDNLELVTRGQNNEHAWQNGLRSQNHEVLVRNVITGEVQEFLSVTRAAKGLGYASDETIRVRLANSAFGTVFHDGYQFKYKSDKRDWVIPKDPHKAVEEAKRLAGLSKPLTVRNCRTGSISSYPSVNQAAESLMINPATIDYRLNKGDKSPLFGYQFKLESDEEAFPSFTKEELEQSLVPSSTKVDCRNLLTGEERSFDSTNLAREFLGVSSLHHPFSRRWQPIFPSGWQCKKSDWEWEEVENPLEAVYRSNRTISARCEDTGTFITGTSARDLGRLLNMDSKPLLSKALTKGKEIYKGYRFRLGTSDDAWPTEND